MRKTLLLIVGAIWLSMAVATAQTRTLTGTIMAAEEGPLPGANVVIKGSTTGTTTDNQGKFSLKIPIEATTVIISSIGFWG
jgi:hypothetical protein